MKKLCLIRKLRGDHYGYKVVNERGMISDGIAELDNAYHAWP
jgi:hypothetical protein